MSIMRSLRRRFRNWLNDYDEPIACNGIGIANGGDAGDFSDNPMTMVIHTVRGGHVITSVKYDRNRGETSKVSYIIRDEDNLNEELARILSLEALR